VTPNQPLFYAEIGTITGLAVILGSSAAFFPCEQEIVYVANVEHVHITHRVPDLLARHLRETVIEPRLAQLGGAV
jgi:hypothetical protein